MRSTLAPTSLARPGGLAAERPWLFYCALVLLGLALWWAARYRAAMMPSWAPWEFSWPWFLAAGLALGWYWRGLTRLPPAERPPAWRGLSYVAGVLAVYAVLQTHFEYLAEHMFFLNRIQHVVMHHIGPFLIVLAWPGAVLRRGMPSLVRRVIDAPIVVSPVRVLQRPVIASLLFVGLVAFWLIPAVHFRAMIDARLYQVMNWSMVVDGILFWAVVLDPRPRPPARVSFGGRAAMALAVAPPQILIGAAIAFAPYDLYNFYAWCGRIYPSIGALGDQQLGGLNIWIPPAMMSGVALILVINALRLDEEGKDPSEQPTDISAAQWTGR